MIRFRVFHFSMTAPNLMTKKNEQKNDQNKKGTNICVITSFINPLSEMCEVERVWCFVEWNEKKSLLHTSFTHFRTRTIFIVNTNMKWHRTRENQNKKIKIDLIPLSTDGYIRNLFLIFVTGRCSRRVEHLQIKHHITIDDRIWSDPIRSNIDQHFKTSCRCFWWMSSNRTLHLFMLPIYLEHDRSSICDNIVLFQAIFQEFFLFSLLLLSVSCPFKVLECCCCCYC